MSTVPCLLVTEGRVDCALLQHLLGPEVESGAVEIIAGTGKGAATAIAQTVILINREPVIVVVDADTADPVAVERERVTLLASLGGPDLARVILAVPTIEAVLFECPEFVQRVLHKRELTPAEMALIDVAPKRALALLRPDLAGGLKDVLPLLDGELALALRETDTIQAILAAAEELLHPVAH